MCQMVCVFFSSILSMRLRGQLTRSRQPRLKRRAQVNSSKAAFVFFFVVVADGKRVLFRKSSRVRTFLFPLCVPAPWLSEDTYA